MTVMELALRLENAFGRFSVERRFSADDFRLNPTESIEEGLLWIMQSGLISKDDYSAMCAEYNFQDMNLREILDDDYHKERIFNLLESLKNI